MLEIADNMDDLEANEALDVSMKYAGCGNRALSSRIRDGISELMVLTQDYKYYMDLAKRNEEDSKSARDMLEFITGERELETFADDIKDELLQLIKESGLKEKIQQRVKEYEEED